MTQKRSRKHFEGKKSRRNKNNGGKKRPRNNLVQIYSQLSVKRTFFGWIHSPEVTTDGTGLQLCLFTPRGQQFDGSLAIFEFLILSSPMGSPLGGTPEGQKWPKFFFQFLNFFVGL